MTTWCHRHAAFILTLTVVALVVGGMSGVFMQGDVPYSYLIGETK